MEARYLYCIVDRDELDLEVEGVGGQPATVQLLPGTDMGVLVSSCRPEECEVRRDNLLRHQIVMEHAMRHCAVLPIRYRTIAEADDPAQVEAMIRRCLLTERRQELRELLQSMRGRYELSLKIMWRDLNATIQELTRHDPVAQRIVRQIGARPPDASRAERIQLGGQVRDLLHRHRERLASSLLRALGAGAVKSTAHKPLGDRMVSNAAFLVEAARREAFDALVEQQVQQHGELSFRCFGPLPPCSFVNLTISWN